MSQRYHISPDFRRDPKTDDYCANCQRDLNGKEYKQVLIDWDLMEVELNSKGKHKIGIDCWRQITKSPVDEKG